MLGKNILKTFVIETRNLFYCNKGLHTAGSQQQQIKFYLFLSQDQLLIVLETSEIWVNTTFCFVLPKFQVAIGF